MPPAAFPGIRLEQLVGRIIRNGKDDRDSAALRRPGSQRRRPRRMSGPDQNTKDHFRLIPMLRIREARVFQGLLASFLARQSIDRLKADTICSLFVRT